MTRSLRAARPRLCKGAHLPSRPVTADLRYYGPFRPCASIVERPSLQLRYFRPHGVSICAFPLTSKRQVPRACPERSRRGSVSEPDPRSRRLKAGHHAGPNQDLAGTAPGTEAIRSVLTSSFRLWTLHRRFPFVRLHGPYLTRSSRAF